MKMKTKEPFGAIAVRLGYATPNQVLEALEEQRQRKTRGEKDVLLGLLMIELGIINSSQLRQVLDNYEQSQVSVCEDAIHLAVRLRASFSEADKIVMFTGAVEREGVSTVAIQVALAMALMEQGPMLLVDTNFRSPSLHRYIRAQGDSSQLPSTSIPGLSELIENKISLQDAIYPSGVSTLSLMPVGNTAVDFLSLLLSEECSLLLNDLRTQYRFIIVDSSPILQFPDSALLASRTDGVVIVLAAGERRKSEVAEIKRALDGLKVPIIGAVLNETSHSSRLGWSGRKSRRSNARNGKVNGAS